MEGNHKHTPHAHTHEHVHSRCPVGSSDIVCVCVSVCLCAFMAANLNGEHSGECGQRAVSWDDYRIRVQALREARVIGDHNALRRTHTRTHNGQSHQRHYGTCILHIHTHTTTNHPTAQCIHAQYHLRPARDGTKVTPKHTHMRTLAPRALTSSPTVRICAAYSSSKIRRMIGVAPCAPFSFSINANGPCFRAPPYTRVHAQHDQTHHTIQAFWMV